MMHTFLYILWFLIPIFFFVMALWAKLEQLGNKKGKKQNPGDFFKQGIFVLGCAIVSVLLDKFVLPKLVETISPDWLPMGFYQAVLLPVVMVLGAKIVGGSEEIRINPSNQSKSNKRGR